MLISTLWSSKIFHFFLGKTQNPIDKKGFFFLIFSNFKFPRFNLPVFGFGVFPPLIHTHVALLFSLLTLFSSSLIPVTFYLHIWKINKEAGLSWPHKDPNSPLQLPSAHTLCVLSNSWLTSKTLKIRVRFKMWICLSSLLSKRKMRRRKENWRSDWFYLLLKLSLHLTPCLFAFCYLLYVHLRLLDYNFKIHFWLKHW